MFPMEGTLALSENMLGVALLSLPLALFGNPLLTYNLMFIAAGPLTAGLWFAVLRRWGLGGVAAWAGGFCFGFLPWRLGQIGHVQLLFTWWIPLCLGATDAWIARGSSRASAALGLCLAGSFYTCVYNFFFSVIFLVPFALVGLAMGPRATSWRRLLFHLALSVGLFLFAVSPAIAPYLSMNRTLNHPNSLEQIASQSASIGDYLRPTHQNYLWGKGFGLGPNPASATPWESRLFLGFTAMASAVAVIPIYWRRRREEEPDRRPQVRLALMLCAGGLTAFVISLGPWLHWKGERTPIVLPYRLLFEILPGFDSIRVPARAGLFVGLALSGMVAFCIDQLLRAPSALGKFPRRTLVLAAVLGILLESHTRPLNVSGNEDYSRHLIVQAEVAQRESGPVLVLPIELKLNYLVPLTTWPHFNPTINGVSGHLPIRTAC